MRTTKKILVGILILISLVGVYYLTGNYSDGYRAGTVIKISKKGYVFTTYEGQLNLGMMLNEGGPSVSNIWEFSVSGSEKEVIDVLEQATLSGERVQLHYKEKYAKLPWRGDTKYFVYKVQRIDKTK